VSAAASSYLYIGLQRDHERLNALEKEIAHLNQIIGEASPKGEVRPQVPAIEVKVTPEDVLLPASGKQLMASEVQNSENKRVKWSINPPGLGSISSTGMYKAPASVRQETQVTVIATSLANPSVSGSAHITLWPNGHPAPLDIDVRPKGQSLRPSESWAFRAYVTGAGSHEVIWSIDPADRGSINPKTGSYTAPSTLPDKNATVMIIATSEADPTKKATLIVTLVPAPSPKNDGASGGSTATGDGQPAIPENSPLEVKADRTALSEGEHAKLTADTGGTEEKDVDWSLNVGAVGSITAGEFIAPPEIKAGGDSVTITAATKTVPKRSGSVTITLTPKNAQSNLQQ